MQKTKVKQSKTGSRKNKIRAILTAKNMSQADLAEKCQADSSHISKIINGKRGHISLAMAMKIANALNSTIEEIFILDK